MALERFERGLQNQLQNARWMSADKTNRQQIAKQNALRDIQKQQAQLGLTQAQDKQNFLGVARNQGVPEAIKQYPIIGQGIMSKQSGAGSSTDISRYVGLAKQKWQLENPGQPVPPEVLMKATLDVKRAQATEAASVAGAKAGVKKDTIAGIKEAEKTGTLTGENNMNVYKSAYLSKDNTEKIDGLITHLNTSDAITGIGAELMKDVERVKTLFGSKIAAIKVSDTETLDAMMGSEVFPLIKSLGIGARGMDTPAERKFLRQVMTGEITLNKQTLLRMAKDRRKVGLRAMTKYNSKIDDGSLDNFFRHSGIPKKKIDIKQRNDAPSLPQGVTEDDITETMRANNMTREAVLSRLGGK